MIGATGTTPILEADPDLVGDLIHAPDPDPTPGHDPGHVGAPPPATARATPAPDPGRLAPGHATGEPGHAVARDTVVTHGLDPDPTSPSLDRVPVIVRMIAGLALSTVVTLNPGIKAQPKLEITLKSKLQNPHAKRNPINNLPNLLKITLRKKGDHLGGIDQKAGRCQEMLLPRINLGPNPLPRKISKKSPLLLIKVKTHY